jgi:UDP-N-acetyl-D-mannosaminuronic acid dehydrogenase
MKIVVIGLGYVGLTLALTLSDVGFKVEGIDKDSRKISKLNIGQPTLYEAKIQTILLNALESNSITFHENISKSNDNRIFIVSVGTPIDDLSNPLIGNLENAVKEVGQNLRKGDTVIVRSTVPVGTTRTVVKKILEDESGLKAASEFSLASAPERTLQGLALEELRNLSQIIGGIDEKSIENAVSIFNKITRTIVRVSSLEAAELIKLFDNTYRDITISIGNLFGKICEELKLDAKEVINAANYGYSRNKILFPGAGVGGGCLVKDPYLLLASMKGKIDLNLIKTSRKINDSMILDTINLIEQSFDKASRKIDDAKILVLGFAFKGYPNTDDIRFSPTLPIIEYLKKMNAKIFGYDPVVPEKEIKNLGISYTSNIYSEKKFDTIIIMNNNPEFKNLNFEKIQDKKTPLIVIDGWYLYDVETMKKMNIEYYAIGSKN